MAGDDKQKDAGKAYWLIYVALLIGGIMLISDASHQIAFLQRVTARLGIGMVYSAFALFVGNGRPAGFFATGIIWVAVLATFLVH